MSAVANNPVHSVTKHPSASLEDLENAFPELLQALAATDGAELTPAHLLLKTTIKLIFDIISFEVKSKNKYQTVWSNVEQKMIGSLELDFLVNSNSIKETKEKIVSLIIFQIDKNKTKYFVGTVAPTEATEGACWNQILGHLSALDSMNLKIGSKILRSFHDYSKTHKNHEKNYHDHTPAQQIRLIDPDSIKKNRPIPFVQVGTPKGLISPSTPKPDLSLVHPPMLTRADSPDFNDSPIIRLNDSNSGYTKHSTRLYQNQFEKMLQRYAYMSKPDITSMPVVQE
jgi:hypothetical protein